MQIYQRIRDLREDMDLSQEKIAQEIKMHKTTYARYEQGTMKIPLDFIITLAKFYNVSLDYLAGLTNDKKGLTKNNLREEETELLQKYNELTEKQKGEIEYHLQQILEQHGLESEVG